MEASRSVQAAINRLVNAAYQRQNLKPDDIDILIKTWDGDVVGATDFIAWGIRLDHIEHYLSHQNLSDCNGIEVDKITNADRIVYARELLISEASEPDADFSPAFMGKEVESAEGVSALVVFSVTGYSFSGVDTNCYGVFRSLDDFKKDAHSKGYILSDEISDIEDTRRWVSDQEILDLWNKQPSFT